MDPDPLIEAAARWLREGAAPGDGALLATAEIPGVRACLVADAQRILAVSATLGAEGWSVGGTAAGVPFTDGPFWFRVSTGTDEDPFGWHAMVAGRLEHPAALPLLIEGEDVLPLRRGQSGAFLGLRALYHRDADLPNIGWRDGNGDLHLLC